MMPIEKILLGMVIYIDLDGVLAKWNEFASEEEVNSRGYFESREPELILFELVKFLLARGAIVKILTAYLQNGYAKKEKAAWLDSFGLPESEVPRVFVPYGDDKYKYVTEPDAVLIDDFGKNLKSWVQSGRKAIKFYNGINNRPKIVIDADGLQQVKIDSWTGPSINRDMTVMEMASIVASQSLV